MNDFARLVSHHFFARLFRATIKWIIFDTKTLLSTWIRQTCDFRHNISHELVPSPPHLACFYFMNIERAVLVFVLLFFSLVFFPFHMSSPWFLYVEAPHYTSSFLPTKMNLLTLFSWSFALKCIQIKNGMSSSTSSGRCVPT